MIIDRSKENFNKGLFDCYLNDDGTLDTIIEINKVVIFGPCIDNKRTYSLRGHVRIDSHDTLDYRDSDGCFTEESFKNLCSEYLDMFDFEHEIVLNDDDIVVIK